MPDDLRQSGSAQGKAYGLRRAVAGSFMRIRVAVRMAAESLWRAGVPAPDLRESRRRQFPSLASMQREWLDLAARDENAGPAAVAADPPATLPFPTEPGRSPAQGARYVGH